jgi:hypothetical protein
MVTDHEIQQIVSYCKSRLDLTNVVQDDAYYYQSLPLCVIDAVFSIGVTYTSTENTVWRFCEYFKINEYNKTRSGANQLSITKFLTMYDQYPLDYITDTIFHNRQRTSPTHGILKSEACGLFARCLRQFQVEYYEDVPKILGNPRFEALVAEIPGQRRGISTRYFYMLAGSDDYIKPDRMISRFIWSAIHRTLDVEESHAAIVGAERVLANEFPGLTPRSLDYLIWQYQRNEKH